MTKNTLYYREFYQKQGTVVQGTWTWADGASQTDFASITGEVAGIWYNSSFADLDEYKWSNIYLVKGVYKIKMTHMLHINRGIAEILFGTTSLATKDMYAALVAYNQVWEITFTLTSDQTADLRYRVNGKNGSSLGHYIDFSRFQIEKTG